MALRAAASAKDEGVLATAAARRATPHVLERPEMKPGSARDGSRNIKASLLQKLNKVGPRPGSAPADKFMRLRTGEDNISKPPPQEAAGGCWCDGNVLNCRREGADGDQW